MARWKVYLITILGAACWGLIGLFVAPLQKRGFTAWDVVAIRAVFTFVFLILIMGLVRPSQLRTRAKDHLFFAGAGVFSIAFFNYFYFEVFSQASLSLAVTLLYTGPLFVMLLSRVFFKEPLTMRKGWALALAIIGCAFAAGLLPFGQAGVSAGVLGMGLLSGFCYALYSIFSKPVTIRYSALTITTYTFFYTSIFLLLTSDITSKLGQFRHPDVWLAAVLLALVATVAGYGLYTTGLTYLEAGRASILSTAEPVVAVITGVLFLGDVLSGWQVMGIVLVLYAAVLVARRGRTLAQAELKEERIN
ncbi:DMT family transporter [Lentibacillus sediminis]|uniref:DMT family transporter n=1 Tax=Lentibacillus sediminis TaxID=1940529 RepID=UPI000C1BE6E5|nr:DMT family transporter [Lentibacillus sediminis]